jgi:hypothetical protein
MRQQGDCAGHYHYYSRADTLLLAVNTGIGVTILPPALKYSYSFPTSFPCPSRGTTPLSTRCRMV